MQVGSHHERQDEAAKCSRPWPHLQGTWRAPALQSCLREATQLDGRLRPLSLLCGARESAGVPFVTAQPLRLHPCQTPPECALHALKTCVCVCVCVCVRACVCVCVCVCVSSACNSTSKNKAAFAVLHTSPDGPRGPGLQTEKFEQRKHILKVVLGRATQESSSQQQPKQAKRGRGRGGQRPLSCIASHSCVGGGDDTHSSS